MLPIAPPPVHSGFPEDHSAGHGTKGARKANTSLLLRRSETIERGKKSDTTPLFAEIKTCCSLCLPPIPSPLSPEEIHPSERCNRQRTLSLSPALVEILKICLMFTIVWVSLWRVWWRCEWRIGLGTQWMSRPILLLCDTGIKLVLWPDLCPGLIVNDWNWIAVDIKESPAFLFHAGNLTLMITAQEFTPETTWVPLHF